MPASAPDGSSSRPPSRWKLYLALRPTSLVSGLRLGSAMVLAAAARVAGGSSTPGVYLVGRTPVGVAYRGLRFGVRPRSEDLEYVLGAHKTTLERWFRPQAGELVVDAGSHLGLRTLLAARAGATVVALEPNPGTARALRENVARNRAETVTVVEAAAGDHDGRVELEVPEIWDGLSSLVPGWSSGARPSAPVRRVAVHAVRLDTVLAASDPQPIAWLLIDVEGWEEPTLHGATRTLARSTHVLLEVALVHQAACERILRSAGFVLLAVEPQTEHTAYLVAERPPEATADRRTGGDSAETAPRLL